MIGFLEYPKENEVENESLNIVIQMGKEQNKVRLNGGERGRGKERESLTNAWPHLTASTFDRFHCGIQQQLMETLEQGEKSIGTNYRFRASFDWGYRPRAGHNSLHQELLHVLPSRTALQ